MYIRYFHPSVNYDIPMHTSLLQLEERVIKIYLRCGGILFTSTIIIRNYALLRNVCIQSTRYYKYVSYFLFRWE